MKKIALFVIAILFCGFNAISCDCGRGRITVETFNSYDWIFVGTLVSEATIEKRPYHWERSCSYKITIAYKGLHVGDIVQVYDAVDLGACGLGLLTVGRNYLIYASGKNKKGTSDCSRATRMPIQSWPHDSASINMLKALKYFSRIYDTTRTNFHADTAFLNSHAPKTTNTNVQKFYDKDGNICAEGKYKNGLPEGLWSYFENGNLHNQGKYINGIKDSIWREVSYGNAYYLREYKMNEYTYRETSFYDNGRIYDKTEPFGDGKTWIQYIYHNNGQARYIAYCKPPQRDSNGRLHDVVHHGQFKMFNKKGIILQQGIDEDGLNVGHWKYYYEDGKIRMEGNYSNGKKTGTWIIYHPNGKIKAEGTYDNEKKILPWKYFNQSGTPIPPDPESIKEDEDWYTYSGVKN